MYSHQSTGIANRFLLSCQFSNQGTANRLLCVSNSRSRWRCSMLLLLIFSSLFKNRNMFILKVRSHARREKRNKTSRRSLERNQPIHSEFTTEKEEQNNLGSSTQSDSSSCEFVQCVIGVLSRHWTVERKLLSNWHIIGIYGYKERKSQRSQERERKTTGTDSPLKEKFCSDDYWQTLLKAHWHWRIASKEKKNRWRERITTNVRLAKEKRDYSVDSMAWESFFNEVLRIDRLDLKHSQMSRCREKKRNYRDIWESRWRRCAW